MSLSTADRAALEKVRTFLARADEALATGDDTAPAYVDDAQQALNVLLGPPADAEIIGDGTPAKT